MAPGCACSATRARGWAEHGAIVGVTEWPLWASIALKMVFAASMVVTATLVAEKSGPLVAGLIIAMPIAVGPTYVMLAWHATPQFIAQSALGSLASNACTGLFCTFYILLARRVPLWISLPLATLSWLVGVWWSLDAALAPGTLLLLNAGVFALALLLTRGALGGRKLLAGAKRWFDLPLRALFVGLFAGTVVTVSTLIGSGWTGVLAAYPILITSSIMMMQPRIGAQATAAAIATVLQGLIVYPLGFWIVHAFSVEWGVWMALLAALAVIVGWAALVYAWRSARPAMRG